MQADKLLEILSYTLPSVITGLVAYYFFAKHIAHEEKRKKFYLHRENQKHSFPLRLQAYERMTLFLERINPNKLLVHQPPNSDDKVTYLHQLVNIIEQEFEHNLTQQIYITDTCWNVIATAKNTTLQQFRNKAADTSIKTAKEMQEAILKEGMNDVPPSVTAITFIKEDVNALF